MAHDRKVWFKFIINTIIIMFIIVIVIIIITITFNYGHFDY
jgi:hypothetical protein